MIEYNLEELKKSIKEMKKIEQQVSSSKIYDCPDEELKSIEDYITKIRNEYELLYVINKQSNKLSNGIS